MRKNPISFYEKVEARFTKRNKGACWPWNGSVGTDHRPQINLRDVIRFIYQHERGPIPEGMVLIRTDHRYDCPRGERCQHSICVNPWHVEAMHPLKDGWGLYSRGNSWPGNDTSHMNEYQRRVRRKKKSNGDNGDPQSLDAADDGG